MMSGCGWLQASTFHRFSLILESKLGLSWHQKSIHNRSKKTSKNDWGKQSVLELSWGRRGRPERPGGAEKGGEQRGNRSKRGAARQKI